MYTVSYLSGFIGGSKAEDCQLCPPGHYCHQRGAAEPSGQCAEGYYCPEGQTSERPQQHVCSVGHYCEKVSHPVSVLKLLSAITAEYCMWCLRVSLPPWLCFSFCHDKCITVDYKSLHVFLIIPGCLSLPPVLCWFTPLCYFCILIMPDDACYSLDIHNV